MIGAIIQARMGSNRLPGKILKQIGGKPLLEHILYRMSFLQHAAGIVVATTENPLDDPVEEFCRRNEVSFFRGSEENVLQRYCLAARAGGFSHVVRLTGDNPFVDIAELDRLIDLHLSANADYSSCVEGLPVGVGAEIFTFAALQDSLEHASAPHHFEHVNEYLLENKDRFRIACLEIPAAKRSSARLTVDTEGDYRRACFIAAHAVTDPVSCAEAVELAKRFESL